jgi:type III pantothenate kinase
MSTPITLCIDFGNTRKKFAIFNAEGSLEHQSDLPEDSILDSVEALMNTYKPQCSILSSVIHHQPEIEELLKERTLFHKLSHQTLLPFKTPVPKPDSIGADRLSLAAAAVHYFPDKNNLVIALGSCITYNFINKYHQFLGGGISPGKMMRFRAMHEYTAKLPLVNTLWNPPLIGYDTATNLQSGVVIGMTAEIDGMIDLYAAKYGNFNVVLTGGDTPYFATQLKNEIFADFNFLFKGLYALSLLNNKGL